MLHLSFRLADSFCCPPISSAAREAIPLPIPFPFSLSRFPFVLLKLPFDSFSMAAMELTPRWIPRSLIDGCLSVVRAELD